VSKRDADLTHSISSVPTLAEPSPPAPPGIDPDELPAGTAIGPYTIRSTIASGGGGTVFLAEDRLLKKPVAIKVLRAAIAHSSVGVARFLREVRVVNMIRHPAIVDIHELGALPGGRPYFAMELLEGSDLRRLITSRGRFPPEDVLEILTPVCSALDAAHAAGIVHRDLKASNLNVAVKDGRYVVKLLDFGIAKLLAPDPEVPGLTAAGTRLGTATAMAPEQIRGEPVDQRTDVYALGVLMYHMMTGRVPFRGFTQQETDRMIQESPAPRPSQSAAVSQAVDAVVLKCMNKNAQDRYPSAQAVLDALREAVLGGPASQAPESSRRAAAVHVDVRPQGDADQSDEMLLDDISSVLDMTEQALREAGFAILLQTGTTLLGARVLSDDEPTSTKEHDDAREQARALTRRIATRSGAHPALRVEVRLHVDSAVLRGPQSSPAIGGVVVDVSAWPADSVVDA
jgi:eukaryotic-like serine/threonine-protein kinase